MRREGLIISFELLDPARGKAIKIFPKDFFSVSLPNKTSLVAEDCRAKLLSLVPSLGSYTSSDDVDDQMRMP